MDIFSTFLLHIEHFWDYTKDPLFCLTTYNYYEQPKNLLRFNFYLAF